MADKQIDPTAADQPEPIYTLTGPRIRDAANKCTDADTVLRVLFPEAFKDEVPDLAVTQTGYEYYLWLNAAELRDSLARHPDDPLVMISLNGTGGVRIGTKRQLFAKDEQIIGVLGKKDFYVRPPDMYSPYGPEDEGEDEGDDL